MALDTHAVTELKLFTENDGDIYRQQTLSILKNLATKKAQGKYDRDLAVRLFMYLAENGAKKYTKEFGGVWNIMFPKDVREHVSKEWRDEFEEEFASGSYKEFIPKKYQNAEASSVHPHPESKAEEIMRWLKAQAPSPLSASTIEKHASVSPGQAKKIAHVYKQFAGGETKEHAAWKKITAILKHSL